MNLFQIDFLQGKTDAVDYPDVVHSLTDSAADRKVISLTLSPDKLASSSSYLREPRRLVFECFPDAWITEYILSGNYEHDRYLSHYEVQVYRDDTLIFTGVIDTSALSWAPGTGILTLTCYEKTKLLQLFSDFATLYIATGGYTLPQILQMFITRIELDLSIDLPLSSADFTQPLLEPDPDPLALDTIDVSAILTLPPDADGWAYSWTTGSGGLTTTAMGWYTPPMGSNRVEFYLLLRRCQLAEKSGNFDRYRFQTQAVILEIYNGLAYTKHTHTHSSGWVLLEDTVAAGEAADSALESFFTEQNKTWSIIEPDLVDPDESVGDTDYSLNYTEDESVALEVSGNLIPTYFHPGDFYPVGAGTETTNCLSVLHAALLMNNATVVSDPDGNLRLLNKPAPSTTAVTIAAADLLSLELSRLDYEPLDESPFSVLAGDTRDTLTATFIAWLNEYHSARWVADLEILGLDTYPLNLHSILSIAGELYAVTEIQPDFVTDSWKINAWKLPPSA